MLALSSFIPVASGLILQISANHFKWAANPRGDAINNIHSSSIYCCVCYRGIDRMLKTYIIWKGFSPPEVNETNIEGLSTMCHTHGWMCQ